MYAVSTVLRDKHIKGEAQKCRYQASTQLYCITCKTRSLTENYKARQTLNYAVDNLTCRAPLKESQNSHSFCPLETLRPVTMKTIVVLTLTKFFLTRFVCRHQNSMTAYISHNNDLMFGVFT